MIHLVKLSVAQNTHRQMDGIMNSQLENMLKEASRPIHGETAGFAVTLVSVYRASKCNLPVDRAHFNKRYYPGIHPERLRKMKTTSVRIMSIPTEISTCGFPSTKQEFTYLTATLSRNF